MLLDAARSIGSARWSRFHAPEYPPSAAVHGGVTHVLALDDVDDVLGDVGGVIADALEVFGNEYELEGGKDHAGISHHVGEQLAEDLVAVVIDLVIGGEDFLRE